jgi:MFS family permease
MRDYFSESTNADDSSFAFSADVAVLVTAQLLGGISAAAVTVLTVLVVTDLTTGTGRFNLVRGFIGTRIAVAASISTTATGFMFQAVGHWEGFAILAGIALIALALLWAATPETSRANISISTGFIHQNENGPDEEPFSRNGT